nr:MAG: hypothetical protein [Bacteriophage sp.]
MHGSSVAVVWGCVQRLPVQVDEGYLVTYRAVVVFIEIRYTAHAGAETRCGWQLPINGRTDVIRAITSNRSLYCVNIAQRVTLRIDHLVLEFYGYAGAVIAAVVFVEAVLSSNVSENPVNLSAHHVIPVCQGHVIGVARADKRI